MEHSDAEVRAGKGFSVSVEALFDAWTNPEQLKQWWRPMGNQLVAVRNDLRSEGEVEYRFESDGQQTLTITGKYLEVKPPEKLVHTWNWQVRHPGMDSSDFKLTLHFRPDGQGSRLEIQQEHFKDRESVLPHQEGWDRALEDLAAFLGSNEEGGAVSRPADHDGKPDYGSQDPAGV